MTEKKDDQTEEIRAQIEEADEAGIRALVSVLHPSDIGRILNAIEEEKAVRLFGLLEPELASEVLLEVDERLRKTLTASISTEALIEVVDEMETDDAADVISELPVDEAKQVLDGMDTRESQEVRKLLVYPEDSAGGKMQAELVSVREDATVEGAIEAVREKSSVIENISNVYVVDAFGRLTGSLQLDKLILARHGARIGEIAEKDPIKVSTDLDQEEVARIFQKYDLIALPVVDSDGRLVGRITVDDVVDVIEEEIFEDFYKMAGLNIEARVFDPPVRSIRMRAPWLLMNLALASITASVVKIFQGTIEKFVVLAVLMPIVAGMGGNAATQTITVVVRGIALGELSLKETKKILFKEFLVGVSNGIVTGAVAALVAYLLGAKLIIGLLLFMAMSANLAIAGLSGALIPLILRWLKFDPAISSSIFVTTCTDIGGFFTFLGLATVFMKMGLL